MIVEKAGDVVIIRTSQGVLMYTRNGIVWNTDIARPIPGAMIMNGKIMQYSGTPPVEVEYRGVKHILLYFDEKRNMTPVYGVTDGKNWYTTTDFIVYSSKSEKRHMKFEDVLEAVKNAENACKPIKICVDGNPIEGLIDHKKGYAEFLYPMVDRVIKVHIPIGELKDEFQEEEFISFSVETVVNFGFNLGDYASDVSVSATGETIMVKYHTYGKGTITVLPSGVCRFDDEEISPSEVKKIVCNGTVEHLDYFIHNVTNPELPKFVGDVVKVIDAIRRDAPTFEKSYAVPKRNQIITSRGEIIVKNLQNIPKPFIRIAEWILGMNDWDLGNKRIYLVLGGPNSSGEVMKKRVVPVKRIGNYYYWYKYKTGKYLGNAGFELKNTFTDVLEYNGRKLVIGTSTLVFPSGQVKLRHGKKISIRDILPGFPKKGRIYVDKMRGKTFMTIGNKTVELIVYPYKHGVRVLLPYKDGLYWVFIDEDADESVWLSSEALSLPETRIIDSEVYIAFGNDVPDDCKLYYGDECFRIEWGNNYIEVSKRMFAGSYIEISNGDVTLNLDWERGKHILYAETFEKAITMAWLL